MADRVQRGSITVTLDDPTVSNLNTKSATLFNANGSSHASADITELAPNRYTATFNLTSTPRIDGIWEINWDSQATTQFTMGEANDLTRHQILLASLAEVEPVVHGKIDAISGQALTDLGLVGGSGDFNGAWLIPWENSQAAGLRFRVKEYNGSVITLIDPVDGLLSTGERFVLTSIDPWEVDVALREAYGLMTSLARVPVKADGLVPSADEQLVSIPNGWTHVHKVYVTMNGVVSELTHRNWSMMSPGLVKVPDIQAESVTLYGTRSAREPVWSDSASDFPGSVVSAFVASKLMSNRARGASTDPDEFLRRSTVSMQKHLGMLSRWVGRIPNGSRGVI